MEATTNADINTTSNSTAEETQYATGSTPFAIVVKILIVLAITPNLLLNPLMLFTLRRVTSIQPTTKIFMASLTLSDLSNSVCWILSSTELFAGTWLLGDFLCATNNVIQYISNGMSLYSLALLTVDRYIAISFPLRYPIMMTVFRSKIIVVSIWAVISILSIVVFGIYDPIHPLQVGPKTYFCLRKTSNWKTYLIFVFILLPLFAIFILYAHITLIARNHARRIAAENQAGNGQGGQRINTRSTTTIIIITGTVFITWIPTLIRVVITKQNERNIYETYLTVMFTQALLLSTGWLNVVIYYLRNRDLRQALCSLLHFDLCQIFTQRFHL